MRKMETMSKAEKMIYEAALMVELGTPELLDTSIHATNLGNLIGMINMAAGLGLVSNERIDELVKEAKRESASRRRK